MTLQFQESIYIALLLYAYRYFTNLKHDGYLFSPLIQVYMILLTSSLLLRWVQKSWWTTSSTLQLRLPLHVLRSRSSSVHFDLIFTGHRSESEKRFHTTLDAIITLVTLMPWLSEHSRLTVKTCVLPFGERHCWSKIPVSVNIGKHSHYCEIVIIFFAFWTNTLQKNSRPRTDTLVNYSWRLNADILRHWAFCSNTRHSPRCSLLRLLGAILFVYTENNTANIIVTAFVK